MAIYVSSINGMGSATVTGTTVTTTGMEDSDHMYVATDFLNQAGVVDIATEQDFQVTEKGTPDMSVDVAAGTAYVANSSYAKDNSITKYWRVESDATVNVTVSANASGNDRIDIACIKVDTGVTPDDEASNVASIIIVEGTPAASPSVPSTPNDHYKLAEIAVANGASSITNANITDRRNLAGLKALARKTESGFMATLSTADQSIPTGSTATKIQFNTTNHNVGSDYNTSSYQYVAPVEGEYHFSVVATLDDLDTGEDSVLFLNVSGGDTYTSRTIAGTTDEIISNALSIDVHLAASTTVTASINHSASTAQALLGVVSSTQRSFFSGHLIRETA